MSADSLTNSIQIESKETAPCTREAAVTVSASGVEKTFNDIVKEVRENGDQSEKVLADKNRQEELRVNRKNDKAKADHDLAVDRRRKSEEIMKTSMMTYKKGINYVNSYVDSEMEKGLSGMERILQKHKKGGNK